MNLHLSPLDGRYAAKVSELAPIFSEFGLMRARVKTEILWLEFLADKNIAPEINNYEKLQELLNNFTEEDYLKIKEIEKTTNHDVKAVEYFLQEFVEKELWPWIHFACTSEDINNISYGLILKDGRDVLENSLDDILNNLEGKSLEWKSVAMLCRTHGQTATPSTMGKEFAVFWYRLKRILKQLSSLEITAKINGATGNWAAHRVAFPDQDWMKLSEEFIEKNVGLDWNPLTTQIESHDEASAMLNEITRASGVLIDLSRDLWGYISLGYFGQKVIAGEVGSSTMPHKVNPIDFENAEGNLKLARGIARTLADELPISRWQRDLTDSTLQRNLGLVFGHFLLALRSLERGLNKIEIKESVLTNDLKSSPEVLTEAVQTVLRKNGHSDAYEQLKDFSRGQALNFDQLQVFIAGLEISEEDRVNLQKLTPENYTGFSEKLVDEFVK